MNTRPDAMKFCNVQPPDDHGCNFHEQRQETVETGDQCHVFGLCENCIKLWFPEKKQGTATLRSLACSYSTSSHNRLMSKKPWTLTYFERVSSVDRPLFSWQTIHCKDFKAFDLSIFALTLQWLLMARAETALSKASRFVVIILSQSRWPLSNCSCRNCLRRSPTTFSFLLSVRAAGCLPWLSDGPAAWQPRWGRCCNGELLGTFWYIWIHLCNLIDININCLQFTDS